MLYGPWPGRFDFHSPAMYCAAIGSIREPGMILPGNGWRVTVLAVGGCFGAERIVDRAQPAHGVQRLREVALALQIGWQSVDEIVRVGLAPLFVGEEVEELVLHDRIAERSAVHVGPAKVDRSEYAVLERVRPGILALIEERCRASR